MLVYLYPIFFFVFFCFIKKKRAHLLYTLLILVYLLAGVSAVIVYKTSPYYRNSYMELGAIVFHCICLFLLLHPFRSFDRFKDIPMEKENHQIIIALSLFFIICSLFAYIELIPQISLYSILNETQDLRKVMEDSGGHTNHLSFFGVKYWTVSLVLAFYQIRFNPKNWGLILLLFLASLCYIADGLRFAGRECILKYSFVFLSFFYFFKNEMNESWRKSLRVFLLVAGGLGVALFAIITFMRFDISQVDQQSSVKASLFSYFGQGFVNFPSIFDLFPHGLTHGTNHFPFLFGYDSSNTITTELNLNTFSTAVGTWIKDLGIVPAFVITCIYSFLLKWITRIRCNVFTLFYVAWALEFVFSLLFFYNDVLNGSRVISLVAIILLDFVTRNVKAK